MAKLFIDVEEAFKSGVYDSGTTGSGKSDIGMYIVEEIKKKYPKATIVVFDPSQDWMERSNIPFVTQPQSSYLEHRDFENMPSVIFEFSTLGITEQQKLVESFCKHLMEWQATVPKQERRKWFIIFEEAHTYFPQGCMRAKRYKNTVRLMTQGRNFGIRFMCITQFASLLDKEAMRYMRQRYFGFTDEPNDLEYVSKFFPKSVKNIKDKLRGLQAGEFLYRKGNDTQLISISPFTTTRHPFLMRSPQLGKVASEPVQEQPQSSPNYTALLKFGVIVGFAVLFLWLKFGIGI